jgi:hypothetical protein
MSADGKLTVFKSMQSAKELWIARTGLVFVLKVMEAEL